jgi:HSP20 family protein
MTLKRWDPFSDLRRVEDTFGRMWRGRHYRPVVSSPGDEVASYVLPLDVIREENEVVIRASVPGLDPKDIEVTVDDGVLTIAGSTAQDEAAESPGYVLRERRTGKFARSVRLPDYVDADKAESRYEHGVISVSLPKSEAARSKRLEIKISED